MLFRSDVDRAVAAARRAFEGPWSTMRPAERGQILFRLVELMKQHADELAELESRDAGKPIAAVLRQDLPAAIDTLTYYAGWADKIHGEVVPTRSDALTYTLREPVGVVGVVVPWNFPLMIGMWKLAPALACGCTVVMKPAELTSLSALRIGELALEAGLPPGVLNIVPGPGRVVGDALVNHPDVDKITFTGSPGVGRGILRGAAGNFKRVSLELGGKSANVIFDDADLDAATKAAAAGIFFNAGQVCSAGSRVLAHEKVYDEVVERIAARARAIRIGDPADRATALGPVISEKQMNAILGYVEIGRKEGASLVTGGARVGDRGYFISPTVFAGVDLIGEAGLATRATLCYGAARASSMAFGSVAAPAVPEPDALPVFFRPFPGLNFVQHFDSRLADGHFPFSGDKDPTMTLWLRHRDAGTTASATALVALADGPPPAAMVRFTQHGPISTMTWAIDMLTDRLQTTEGWWLVRSTAETIVDGYSSQAMTVWNAARQPVMVCRQNIAVFV